MTFKPPPSRRVIETREDRRYILNKVNLSSHHLAGGLLKPKYFIFLITHNNKPFKPPPSRRVIETLLSLDTMVEVFCLSSHHLAGGLLKPHCHCYLQNPCATFKPPPSRRVIETLTFKMLISTDFSRRF